MKYEREVFRLGNWKNYDDLEEHLTLEELIETYSAIIDEQNRQQRNLARMMGAKISEPEEFGAREPGKYSPDIVTNPIKHAKSGDIFGINNGIGYEVIGG